MLRLLEAFRRPRVLAPWSAHLHHSLAGPSGPVLLHPVLQPGDAIYGVGFQPLVYST